jgi:hypothetical protein
MIEKYSLYEFEIFGGYAPFPGGDREFVYRYEIYSEGCPPYDDGVIESSDYFENEQEARLAAIDHIDRLENGES